MPQPILYPGAATDVKALPSSCWAKRKINDLTNADPFFLDKSFTKIVARKF